MAIRFVSSAIAAATLCCASANAHPCWIDRAVSAKGGIRVYLSKSLPFVKRMVKIENGSEGIVNDSLHRQGRRVIFIPYGDKIAIGPSNSLSDACEIYPDRKKGIIGLSYLIPSPSPPVPLPLNSGFHPQAIFLPASRR
jgi:hypothetical protein